MCFLLLAGALFLCRRRRATIVARDLVYDDDDERNGDNKKASSGTGLNYTVLKGEDQVFALARTVLEKCVWSNVLLFLLTYNNNNRLFTKRCRHRLRRHTRPWRVCQTTIRYDHDENDGNVVWLVSNSKKIISHRCKFNLCI